MDARDFIRGARPWGQFLTYCDVIAQEEGGRLWAAQLSDPRFEDEIRRRLEEQTAAGRTRPPLEGYSALVKAADRVANQIRLLINAMTQSELPLFEGPEGPLDRIDASRKARSNALVDAALIPAGGDI